ncbi:MAG: ribosome silencing factor [Burkholderiales bacterium]|nr:ribosome silencing factor [Burkholderiales bacterium]
MDIRKLQRAIVDGLEDVKAQDIKVFNTEHLSPLFERVIVASGTSNRQVKALAASVRSAVRAAGFQVMRTEGEANGEWIIVDCAAAVVHLMQPAIRQYYLLEDLWGEKPVKIELKASTTRLVKASEPMDEEDEPAPKRATGKKSVAGKLDAPVKKVAAKKTPAKKVPALKKTAAKPVAVKKVAAKKVAAKKVAAKKVAAKKAVAPAVTKTLVVNRPMVKKVAGKKIAAKKVAAKKAPARKVAAKTVAAKAPAKKVARTRS